MRSLQIISRLLKHKRNLQRGDVGGSAKKVGKRIKELERVQGVRDGSSNEKGKNRIGEPNNSVDKISQSDIASQMGISVDTLQNYKMLATIIDVMEWMINTQLGRRNLPPQQRIAVVKKFEKRIQEQAKENQSEAGKKYGNGKNSSSPNGEKLNDKKIRTDKELAKLAGVGTGTIARFNRVMSSDKMHGSVKMRKTKTARRINICGQSV